MAGQENLIQTASGGEEVKEYQEVAEDAQQQTYMMREGAEATYCGSAFVEHKMPRVASEEERSISNLTSRGGPVETTDIVPLPSNRVTTFSEETSMTLNAVQQD